MSMQLEYNNCVLLLCIILNSAKYTWHMPQLAEHKISFLEVVSSILTYAIRGPVVLGDAVFHALCYQHYLNVGAPL